MFLSENFSGLGNGNRKLSHESNNLAENYEYWKETLFERCMRLFEWNCDGVPQKEIEQRLLLQGFCIITKLKDGQLVCASGSMHEQSIYYDEFKKATYSTPYECGVKVINENCVIIDNTSIRNSLFHLIHKYALMLAHTDISIICELVNTRSTKTFSAKNKSIANTVNEWFNRLYNGKMTSILDDYTDALQSMDTSKNATNLLELIECRTQLLKSFYTDIGIKCSYDKKERMNVEEVGMDEGLLLININDMLASREKGCEEVNKMFGLNWGVKKSIEYQSCFDIEAQSEVNEDEN